MKISICHPSFKRPEKGINTSVDTISKQSMHNNIEYILSLSITDPTINEYQEKVNSQHHPIKIIVDDGDCWTSSVNFAAKQSTGDLIIVAADDFIFPNGWDSLLLFEILNNPHFGKDYVIAINDGNRKDNLLTLPICSREYYQRIGYIIYPEYVSVYGDNDFTEMAYYQNKVIEARHLLFKHNHYTIQKEVLKDETYEKINNKKLYKQGKEILEKRRKNNFGL